MLERLTLGAAWSGEVPYMLPLIRHPWINRFIPSFHQRTAELQKFGQFARNNVSSRIDRGSGDRKDMLTYTLQAHINKPDVYTKSDIVSDAHTIVFAGSDTTAIVCNPHEHD
jgi:cytochrome P450